MARLAGIAGLAAGNGLTRADFRTRMSVLWAGPPATWLRFSTSPVFSLDSRSLPGEVTPLGLDPPGGWSFQGNDIVEPPLIRKRSCKRCGKPTQAELAANVCANEVVFIGWWCTICRGWAQPGMWIPKAKVLELGVKIEALPVRQMELGERCIRCYGYGAEYHHWAPKALFREDFDKWPGDYLCRRCHDRWHTIMTPGLVRKP